MVGEQFTPRLTPDGEGLGCSDGASRNVGYEGIFNGKIGTGVFILEFLHPQDELLHAMIFPPPQRYGGVDIDVVGFFKDITVVHTVSKQSLFQHTIKICVGILKLSHSCLLNDGEDK